MKKAFTLVELIVVITILAILGTIAFISLQGYSANARDSKRISDVNSIKTSLGLFFVQSGKYPLPDSGVEYSFSGELLWTQGFIGETVIKNLSRNIQEIPLDPSMDTQYVYSVSSTKTEYEILANYELDNISNINLNNGAYATNFTPKITGTYNQIYVKTPNYIIPSPSIINALNQTTDFNTDNQAIQSQVISLGENNIANGKISSSTGALTDFVLTYTGAINSKSSDADKISVINTLQQAYSGTRFASNSEISYILSKTTEENKKDLAEQIILNSGVVSSNTPQDQPQDQGTPVDYCPGINTSLVSYWKFDNESSFSENFSTFDTNRWSFNNGGTVSVSNNKLNLVVDPTISATWDSAKVTSNNWTAFGNFDLEVSYVGNIWENSTSTYKGCSIVFNAISGNANNCDQQYSGFTYIVAGKYSSSNTLKYFERCHGVNNTYTVPTSGKMRYTRTGNQLIARVWNGTSRDTIDTISNFVSEPVKIGLDATAANPGGNVSCSFSNFNIANLGLTSDVKGNNNLYKQNFTLSSGFLNNGYLFNGNNYLTSYNPTFKNETIGSISAWVKPTTDNLGSIFSMGDATINSNAYVSLEVNGENGDIYTYANSGYKYLGNFSGLTKNVRNHIVWTQSSSSPYNKIYVNGVEKTITYTQGSDVNYWFGNIVLETLTIGARYRHYNGDGIYDRYFTGGIDEIAYFNKALSSDEIQKIYNDGVSGNSICGN